MAVYWLTCRIGEGAEEESEQRRQRVLDAVRVRSTMVWEETGGFVVFESDKSVAALAAAVRAVIDAAQDLVVLEEMHRAVGLICGISEQPQRLKRLMPHLQEL